MQMPPREALIQIYNTNGGNAWVKANNWNTYTHICTWTGVRCDAQKQIVGLDMSGFGLTGQLADVFSAFP